MLCVLILIFIVNNSGVLSNPQNIWSTILNRIYARDRNVQFDEMYDFIIIGGGTAGSVIASRLSEESDRSVLLLEAGGEKSIFTDIPIIAPYFKLTGYNWGYEMERQEGLCLGMINQMCKLPRGKVIGGSSVINYMVYTRGHQNDWDRIAADGNEGWSYNDVFPYYLKSERANLKHFHDPAKHNKNGLLSIESIPYRTELVHAFIEAGKELGNEFIDYNDGNMTGFSYIQAHMKNGRRHSAAEAFLDPFRNRKNLHISLNSRVIKININPETKHAESVTFLRNKRIYTVPVKKEVILSAGAFASPQLLMLSGIGPSEHLQEMGIDVIENLNVGTTLYDHVAFPGLVFLINKTGAGLTGTKLNDPRNLFNWLQGKGPSTIPAGLEGIAYVNTDQIEDYPNIELTFAPGALNTVRSRISPKGYGVTDEFYNAVYKEIEEKEAWSVFPMITNLKSKGSIKLKDKNPFHWPRIIYDFFSDKEDLATMVKGIKYALKLSETSAFQKYGSILYDKHFPTCEYFPFGTDEYWECAARILAIPLQHHIGTCKMGPPYDPDAVVDNELKVYGIVNLRVADASIIPRPILAHTEAQAIMIGEKLSDILKVKWK